MHLRASALVSDRVELPLKDGDMTEMLVRYKFGSYIGRTGR